MGRDGPWSLKDDGNGEGEAVAMGLMVLAADA